MQRDVIRLTTAVMAIGVGVLAAFLPGRWIEELLGVEPDGGNGFLELLFVIVPIGVGIGLAAPAIVRALSQRFMPSRTPKNT